MNRPVLLLGLLLAACSRPAETLLPRVERQAAFAAIKKLLAERFGGVLQADPEEGLVLSDYFPPDPSVGGRLQARVELEPAGNGVRVRVQVTEERLAFDASRYRMVWARIGRARLVEQDLLREIRERLGREVPVAPGGVVR